MNLQNVTAFLDNCFPKLPFADFSNNGLQIEASTEISRLAFAVDASLETFAKAADDHADLLVVHHGLSWGDGLKRLDGYIAARIAFLFSHRLSLYAVHLPLDLHPQFGNNAVLANLLNLRNRTPFFPYQGVPLGFAGELPAPMTASELAHFMDRAIGATSHVPVDNGKTIRTIGVVSGAGDDAIFDAAELHLDALLTGEFSYKFYHPARELGLTVITAGHYATETTGPRALCQYAGQHLNLPCTFIDTPNPY